MFGNKSNNVIAGSVLKICALAMGLLLVTCDKEDAVSKIKIETHSIQEIGQAFCIVNGNIIYLGGEVISDHGFCFSESENPTVLNKVTRLGERSTLGSFSDTLMNLVINTTYYFRAYAQTADNVYYDDQKSFTTSPPSVPTITTKSISEITLDSANSGGEVLTDGGAIVTARGVCWSTSQSPKITDNFSTDGDGIGAFSSTLTGLSSKVTYYVKAYATNSAGTGYGEQVSFISSEKIIGLPVVTTTLVNSITETTAMAGGSVTSDGGSEVFSRGVCWSKSPSPTTADSHVASESGLGNFSVIITGLDCEEMYYVKAYATNGAGTAYGSEVSFTANDCPVVPISITTSPISNITTTSAQSGGDVLDEGGSPVFEKGVCWSTNQDPTIEDPHSSDGSGPGSYTSTLTGLICSKEYFVRAYATNSEGTNYGAQVEFTADECTSVTDFDGNIYNIVTIGDQIWMQENLKVIHYPDGAAIPLKVSTADWDNLTETGKGYCYYDNNPSNRDIYGNIYSWAAIMNGASSSNANPSGIQGVCPDGWHLPSDAEWVELTDHLGGLSLAGDKMKEAGTSHWSSPNEGTNESKFTALPGGFRYQTGGFDFINNSANFWSTSTEDALHAYVYYLGYSTKEVKVFNSYKDDGFYVRCIKNK